MTQPGQPRDPWHHLARLASQHPDRRPVDMPPGFDLRVLRQLRHSQANQDLDSEQDLLQLLRRLALTGIALVILSIALNAPTLLNPPPVAAYATQELQEDLVAAALFRD